MNKFNKAARHVLRIRMTKRAFSEEGAAALEHLAETGQMPEEMVNKLVAKYQNSSSDDMWQRIKRRAVQGLGIGGTLGLGLGGVQGIAAGGGLGTTAAYSLGSGLRNAGIGSIIGGGIGALESYLGADKNEKEQIRRILSKLQNSQPQEEPQAALPPEAVMASMQAPTMPASMPTGLPSITYNIHNFGPQTFQPNR